MGGYQHFRKLNFFMFISTFRCMTHSLITLEVLHREGKITFALYFHNMQCLEKNKKQKNKSKSNKEKFHEIYFITYFD